MTVDSLPSNEALGKALIGQNEGNASHLPNNKFAAMGFNRPIAVLPGDHIRKETPVPIPNTVVKLSEPMIVQQTRK